MSSFARVLELFTPLNGHNSLLKKRLNIFSLFQVRNNCPWHRSSFTQAYFPFEVKKMLKQENITRLLESEGGKHKLMKQLLGEEGFIAWNWPAKKKENDRLSYPL